MKLLVDSHAFLWAITEDDRMSIEARRLFADPNNDLWLSAASLWEIVIKASLGKLPLPPPIDAYIRRHLLENSVQVLPVYSSHVFELAALPLHHRDPFDRMLVAQSRVESMPILSADPLLRAYPVEILW